MTEEMFDKRKPLVGVIHVGALPGTPRSRMSVGELTESAVREAKSRCRLPVLLGSGVTIENVSEFYDTADGFIVSSYFKEGGLWSNTVERERVERLADALRDLRERGTGERRDRREASDTSGNRTQSAEEH